MIDQPRDQDSPVWESSDPRAWKCHRYSGEKTSRVAIGGDGGGLDHSTGAEGRVDGAVGVESVNERSAAPSS